MSRALHSTQGMGLSPITLPPFVVSLQLSSLLSDPMAANTGVGALQGMSVNFPASAVPKGTVLTFHPK